VALLALVLLPLFYPLVDVTNWLRLAATRNDTGGPAEANGSDAALRRLFATYAVETALIGLLVCALGAIAGPYSRGRERRMSSRRSPRRSCPATTGRRHASTLFAVCVFAAALSTTSALLAAGLCTLRYDLLSPLRAGAASGDAAAGEAIARRRTLVVGLAGLAAAFITAADRVVADSNRLRERRTSRARVRTLLRAALFCAACARSHRRRRARRPSSSGPGWAMAIIAVGFGTAVATAAGFLATGVDAWLWSAAPAALVSGFALFAIGRAASLR
jgi:hypothetical protein